MTGTANSESILGGHCILQSTDEENQDPQRSKASSSSPNELMAEWGSSPLSQKIRTLSTITLRRWSICLQCRRHRFNAWIRKIPWRRKWQPTPVSLPEKSHGQRSLVGYSPWGHKQLDMTEWLSMQRTTLTQNRVMEQCRQFPMFGSEHSCSIYSNVPFYFYFLKSYIYCLWYLASLGPTWIVKASQKAFSNKRQVG